jgi:hypothetical protein
MNTVTRASANGSRKFRSLTRWLKTRGVDGRELSRLPMRHRRKIGLDLPAANLAGQAHRFG